MKLWHLNLGLAIVALLIVGYIVWPATPTPTPSAPAQKVVAPAPAQTVSPPAQTVSPPAPAPKTWNLWATKIKGGHTEVWASERDIESRATCELLLKKELDFWLRYGDRILTDSVMLRDPQTREIYSRSWHCADSTVDYSSLNK